MTQMNDGMGAFTVFAQSGPPAAPQAGAAPAAAPQSTTAAPASGTTAAPASGTTAAPGGTPNPNPQASPFGNFLLPMMVVFIGLMMIGPLLAGRKEKKKRAELMSNLKKGDKVQMLGGIIGTIGEIGDEDVVVKIEEGRIRFHKSAIQSILSSRGGKSDTSITEVKGEAKAAAV